MLVKKLKWMGLGAAVAMVGLGIYGYLNNCSCNRCCDGHGSHGDDDRDECDDYSDDDDFLEDDDDLEGDGLSQLLDEFPGLSIDELGAYEDDESFWGGEGIYG